MSSYSPIVKTVSDVAGMCACKPFTINCANRYQNLSLAPRTGRKGMTSVTVSPLPSIVKTVSDVAGTCACKPFTINCANHYQNISLISFQDRSKRYDWCDYVVLAFNRQDSQ